MVEELDRQIQSKEFDKYINVFFYIRKPNDQLREVIG